MHAVTGMSKIERLIEKDRLLDTMQSNDLEYLTDELMSGKPLQYALGTAWFMGREFIVNEQVLIPRPETEELLFWILNDKGIEQSEKSILDVGTGSGCIPIALQLEWPSAKISSCDVSEGALALAHRNAARHGTPVHFFRQDIRDETLWPEMPAVDIIVSNPPYIPQREQKEMDNNVVGFEPHLALFVPDDDPLLFYRKIALLGTKILRPAGLVYCELHRDFPEQTREVFLNHGYTDVELKKDMHDNWRMIRASR